METLIVAGVSGETASLSLGESEMLSLVGSSDRPTLPLEDASSRMEEVRKLVSSRHLMLLAVEYPWGVQFELGLSKKGADYLANLGKVVGRAEPIQEAKIS